MVPLFFRDGFRFCLISDSSVAYDRLVDHVLWRKTLLYGVACFRKLLLHRSHVDTIRSVSAFIITSHRSIIRTLSAHFVIQALEVNFGSIVGDFLTLYSNTRCNFFTKIQPSWQRVNELTSFIGRIPTSNQGFKFPKIRLELQTPFTAEQKFLAPALIERVIHDH